MRPVSTSLIVMLLVLCFGVAGAQTHKVTLDHVVGLDKDGKIIGGGDVEFHIRATNVGEPNCRYNPAFGFRVYSEDGATWGTTAIDPAVVKVDTLGSKEKPVLKVETFAGMFTQHFIEKQGATGSGADSVGFSGITMGGKVPGISDGLDMVVLVITVKPTAASAGKHICLDIAKGMPSYEWEWSGLGLDKKHPCKANEITPEWDGPHCFVVK